MENIDMEDGSHYKDYKKRIAYEEPLFEKQIGMVFPQEIIEKFNGGHFCVQCSSCHGCKG